MMLIICEVKLFIQQKLQNIVLIKDFLLKNGENMRKIVLLVPLLLIVLVGVFIRPVSAKSGNIGIEDSSIFLDSNLTKIYFDSPTIKFLKPHIDSNRYIKMRLNGYGVMNLNWFEYKGKIGVEIPSSNSQGDPILGGKYRILMQIDTPEGVEFGNYETKEFEIYTLDFGHTVVGGNSQGDKIIFDFNVIDCEKFSQKHKIIEFLLKKMSMRSRGMNEDTNRNIDFTPKIPYKLPGNSNIAPCGCEFYTISVIFSRKNVSAKFSALTKFFKEFSANPIGKVSYREGRQVFISPNVERWLGGHGVYYLGPDSASYKGTPPAISPTALLKDWKSNSSGIRAKKVRLVVFDSGVSQIPTYLPKVIGDKTDDFLLKTGLVNIGKGHGTPIAYIASQGVGNGKLEIYSEKVCDSEGHCPESKIIPALCHQLDDAIKSGMTGKTVFNMSLFSASASQNLERVIEVVTQNDIHIVAAAGNAGSGHGGAKQAYELFGVDGMLPAGARKPGETINDHIFKFVRGQTNTWGVASIDQSSGGFAESSIHGNHENLVACGRWLQSVDPNGHKSGDKGKNGTGEEFEYPPYSGTSFATAVVSGKLLSLLSQGIAPKIELLEKPNSCQ
jgi:hypothetical protein